MHPLTLGEIADAVNGSVPESARSLKITSVCRNTKEITAGALFVPLKGARADGHIYIPAAVEAGAVAAFSARDDISTDIPLVRVENTLTAAQTLAAYYRTKMGKPVFGVTGSAGKTTTAAMLLAILRNKYRPATTPADDNGQIGLTFSVFRMEDADDLAVWEMGMSQYNELHRLTMMVRPDIAIINGIGTAHIEFFGKRENILKAKLEILDGMKPGSPLILNGDDDLLSKLDLPFAVTRYSMENPAADIYGEVLSSEGGVTRLNIHFQGAVYERIIPAVGRHNVLDALAAFGAAAAFGMKPEEISLEGFQSVGGRQNIVEKHGRIVMEDWYNASPEAVDASLNVLKTLCKPGHSRFAALGCMRELGEQSPALHIRCGKTAAQCCDRLYVYGEGAEYYLEGARDAGMPSEQMEFFTSRDELAARLAAETVSGDALLFKGSHYFTHMEFCMQEFYRILDEKNQ